MKISNHFKTITKTFVAVAAVSVVFSACKKKYNDIEPIELAGLTIVNASPDIKEYDFIIGNQKANSKEVFKYGVKIGYLGLYPGTSGIGLVEVGKTNFLLTKNELYQSGKFYSTFLVDTGSKRAFFTINDKLDSIKVNEKAKVRFINLSPNADALDLAITGSATEIATNKVFKQFSVFTDVEPGESVALELKDNATKVVKATLPPMKLEKGKFYTVWAKGFKDKAVTDSLSLKAAIYTAK
ncbi:DUF4397 domain-containing protein [Pedobacter gandavensis]|uniref:DUF4397 domain-containing protein n=1 Tax=Pedobacter gandavensis TaxID=2679963 RepID=A0ABR6EYS7_9SPHI|nr:DUF4397 domain-containing protein [Pedobacter gandavensis]MBB2150121.1 DUF4397 domain-containing protein [Pedobacter gandavensis]